MPVLVTGRIWRPSMGLEAIARVYRDKAVLDPRGTQLSGGAACCGFGTPHERKKAIVRFNKAAAELHSEFRPPNPWGKWLLMAHP